VDDELSLTDLDSTNGTFVNGLRIVGARLRGDEVIRIGSSALRVQRVGDGLSVQPSQETNFGRVVGASLEMRRLYPLCQRIAASDVTVLIEGDTGTGKEALAESIHEASARAAAPFVVFDCTEAPPSLVESALFGHERGAFTGATSARKGVFEQAHGGTLFIDEIGELEPELQPKLLRAVERAEILRVGGDRRIPVDVRIIAATRRDLDREVQEGRFRDDLFFRLAVTRIELPPLRTRRGDIAVLAAHFWTTLGGAGKLPYDLLRQFETYAWPGNVRELRNAVARRMALGDLALAQHDSAPAPTSGAADPLQGLLEEDLPYPRARARLLREFEKRYIERVLWQNGGNVTQAAQASGIARRYFNVIRSRQGTKR
jgi:DNA-binding NtrC family response regulator